MLIPLRKIVISQVDNAELGSRSGVFEFDFINKMEFEKSVEMLSGIGSVTLPRKIYFKDDKGQAFTWYNKNVISGQETTPIILRGDKISISLGYTYEDPNKRGTYITELNSEFEGFITAVNNASPITFEIAEYGYLLAQTQVDNKLYLEKEYSLEIMLTEMLAIVNKKYGTNIRLDVDKTITNIGDYRTINNPTVTVVLNELKQKYNLTSYFQGDILRVGAQRFFPENRKEHVFHFQKNIIENNLQYTRSDDVRVGIKAVSIIEKQIQSKKKTGELKTKREKIEGFAGDRDGDIRTLHFYNIKTVRELEEIAKKYLPKVKFEGFKGMFTTFGLPSVKIGDVVTLIDDVITERKGKYLVKSVKKRDGYDTGIRQDITLDLRLDILTQQEQKAAI